MPERPDLRQIAVNIKEALADYDRDALLDMLTYVFKEYVVEGVPPALLGRADTVEELSSMSFAEIMTTLQTRLDAPELGLFQVQGDSVSVRVGGVMTPLSAGDVPTRRGLATEEAEVQTAEAPPEPPPPRSPRSELRPGVNVMEGLPQHTSSTSSADEARARGRGDLVGESRAPVQAPPPRRGVSVSGRPASSGRGAAAPAPAQRPAPAQTAAPTPTSSAKKADESKPEPEAPKDSEDSSSIRFSLLELD